MLENNDDAGKIRGCWKTSMMQEKIADAGNIDDAGKKSRMLEQIDDAGTNRGCFQLSRAFSLRAFSLLSFVERTPPLCR